VLQDRARVGVEVRVIGRVAKHLTGVDARTMSDLHLMWALSSARVQRRSSAARAFARWNSMAGARSGSS
jgi:hypothetical protein